MAAEKTTQPTAKDAELAASKAAVGEAYEKLLEARDHFKAAAQAAGMDVRQDALEQLLKGREKAEALGDQATSYVREKPLATLGIAFAAGFVLAQLFSRK